MSDQEAAVEHLTRQLERDVLTVEEHRGLVDRVLATTEGAVLKSRRAQR